jgi:hypothetical protein
VRATSTVAALARRLRLRAVGDAALDRLRLEIDGATMPRYQPQEFIRDRARPSARELSTISRWEAIAPVVSEAGARSALDLGCNVGWFTLKLAALGMPAVGVEHHPPAARTALYAVRRSGLPGVGVLQLPITPASVRVLPAADAVLALSVWHHFVNDYGYEPAVAMLEAIWQRTGRVLLFETGEGALAEEFGIPAMTPDARTWIAALLERTCKGGSVRHLGMHDDGSGKLRNLFGVVREAAA